MSHRFATDPAAFERAVAPALESGPVVARLEAPLDVDVGPLTAFDALAGAADAPGSAEYAFLLESAGKVASSDPDGAFTPGASGDRHARFSFVGYDPDAVVTVGPDGASVERLRDSAAARACEPGRGDVLDTLRGALPSATRVGFDAGDRQRLDGGLVGFLAYDAVYDLWLEEVGLERPDGPVPDAEFVLTTRTLAFDHAAGTAALVLTPVLAPGDDPRARYEALATEAERVAATLADAEAPTPGGFERTAERAGSRAAYEAAVERAREHVLDGDVYQAVISRSRVVEGDVDPAGLYAALRAVNPSPYMYLLRHGGRSVVGASPETLVSVRDREVVSNPIAGTCPRGESPVEDRRLAGELLADDKERAEHTMLVDLARNDLRRVCGPGTVQVAEFMNVLKYSHVQHIESTVVGELAGAAGGDEDPPDAFDAARATFPAGTLAGAPKVRAMELVDALETSPRGLYGGGVGYFSWTGDADFAIVIRTATVERGEPDRVTVRAGAGIVADSDPASEYDETEAKMDGVLAALDRLEAAGLEANR
ncbi:MAG: anthranilate synthase component I [Halobacteriales archaeon]|nr:anthranilate synthase component I [Halobacteriales archaeon]